MDHATFARESALNRLAYEQFCERIQREFAGKYVALAHGKIIGAADSFDEARGLVERSNRPPNTIWCFPRRSSLILNLCTISRGSI